MINSLNSTNIPKCNRFGNVTNRTNNFDYWLKSEDIKIGNQNSTIESFFPETIILDPDEARKTNNLKIIGLSIAGVTVFAAAAILFVLRGGPKGAANAFQKLRDIVERKIQLSKLTGNVTLHYEFLLGRLDDLLAKSEAVNNFTTIKDFAFKKLMYGLGDNWEYTRKIHNGITNMFEKLGLKTVFHSYSKTSKNFAKLRELNLSTIEQLSGDSDLHKIITINGVSKSKKDWISIAKNFGLQIDNLFKENFSDTMRQSRYLQIKKFTKELEQNFDEKGPLWFLSSDTLNSFVAESKMLPKKLEIQSQIKNVRQQISYTPLDLFKEAEAKILKISSYLKVSDKDTLGALNKIRDNFKSLSKASPLGYDDMIKDLDDFYERVCSAQLLKGNPTSLEPLVQELKELYVSFQKGSVQNILEIYKELLPKEKYMFLEKAFSNSVKSLDKSIKLETKDFINKSRDLAMGSAPTDILAMLGGLGTLAYYLGKSDNNQERVAITLKYGIPALVGIGVSLYGNARLFAGSKSLLLAGVSSIIANRIGSFSNNLFESYLKKNGIYIEPKNSVE